MGAKTVVQAVEYSKKVAEAMDEYMKAKKTAVTSTQFQNDHSIMLSGAEEYPFFDSIFCPIAEQLPETVSKKEGKIITITNFFIVIITIY